MGWLEASPKDTRSKEAVETGLSDRKGLSTSLSKQDKHVEVVNTTQIVNQNLKNI